ncbi:PQQ-binding-like beta-propeller repeat protein [Hydrogenimonas sp. SS33]|uniref:WD40 repeat domain-containing protein n=1 Tax=Hydrogenimonas leucolamina TaxID=2954236 RepID=UPI00336C03C6
MRIVWALMATALLLFSETLHPSARLEVPGIVTDIALEGNRLYVATDEGSVTLFDLDTLKLLGRLRLPETLDGAGKKIPMRIESVDVRKGRVLVTAIGKNGFRQVWLFGKGKVRSLVSPEKRMMVRWARFAGDGHVVLLTYGAEILRYSLEEGGILYRKEVSGSTPGDMSVDGEGRYAYVADEGGEVWKIDLASGERVGNLPSKHLDQIFSIAHAGGVMVTGGRDRKVVVLYRGRRYTLWSGFPVYCVGLSPDGGRGVYSDGDAQLLKLFDTATGRIEAVLEGHRSVVNRILFAGNGRLVTSEQGPAVLIWDVNSTRKERDGKDERE